MAVLIEGISVVVRADAINAKHVGGAEAFGAAVPAPATLCADGELARIGFMTPDDAKAYVEALERKGLRYVENGKAVDIVVVDQRTGLRAPCDWAAFGHTTWSGDPKQVIAICHAQPTSVEHVTVPNGWRFEHSLSARHRFVEAERLPETMKLVRREAGGDVYLDENEGREYYVGRSNAGE